MSVPFNQKLKAKKPLIGTLVTLASAEITEIMGRVGYDWVFVDMEHGPLSPLDVQGLIQSTPDECAVLVRIPQNDDVWIKKALDLGCDGVIVPLVNSAEEARMAVESAKYPPIGKRSVGVARAQGYGLSFQQYVQSANEIVSLIVQIEHIVGVKNITEILNVKGIDGVFIGPYDLSGSLNKLGDISDEEVQSAITTVRDSCASNDMPYGIFVMAAEAVANEIHAGVTFIAVGIDTTMLATIAKKNLEVARDGVRL
jgi:2-keto-3-deoxy-L-rhamnonate aldolase RhmA